MIQSTDSFPLNFGFTGKVNCRHTVCFKVIMCTNNVLYELANTSHEAFGICQYSIFEMCILYDNPASLTFSTVTKVLLVWQQVWLIVSIMVCKMVSTLEGW